MDTRRCTTLRAAVIWVWGWRGRCLEARADISAKSNYGSTPLHRAAMDGHLEVARVLLEARADITAKNNEGYTPLDLAAHFGHGAVVALLVEAFAAE